MKIKNLKNQIQIVGSKNSVDNIKFYNKLNSSGGLILGFKAVSGSIVMISSVDGRESFELEKAVFSNITEPKLLNIELLIEKLNSYIR